jgi:hypothetical protein
LAVVGYFHPQRRAHFHPAFTFFDNVNVKTYCPASHGGARLQSNCAPSHSPDLDLRVDESCRVPVPSISTKHKPMTERFTAGSQTREQETRNRLSVWETDDHHRPTSGT